MKVAANPYSPEKGEKFYLLGSDCKPTGETIVWNGKTFVPEEQYDTLDNYDRAMRGI